MAETDWKQTIVAAIRDNVKLLFFAAGIIAVVLAAAKGVSYKEILPITDPPSRIGLVAFGVLLIILGFFESKLGGQSSRPTAKDFGIEITHPQAGDAVSRLDVRGKITRRLPPGYTLWVFRMYRDGNFWPVRKCMVYDDTGEWEAIDCDLGVSPDKKFFAVNLVGPDGAALIDYVYTSMASYNGLRDKLSATGQSNIQPAPVVRMRTSDMIECKRVKVTRA